GLGADGGADEAAHRSLRGVDGGVQGGDPAGAGAGGGATPLHGLAGARGGRAGDVLEADPAGLSDGVVGVLDDAVVVAREAGRVAGAERRAAVGPRAADGCAV